MKKTKHIINIAQWKNNVLDVSEIMAETFEEAKEFVKLIVGADIRVKIYDEFKRLVYSDIINNIREEIREIEAEFGHHEEYGTHEDYDRYGNDHRHNR